MTREEFEGSELKRDMLILRNQVLKLGQKHGGKALIAFVVAITAEVQLRMARAGGI